MSAAPNQPLAPGSSRAEWPQPEAPFRGISRGKSNPARGTGSKPRGGRGAGGGGGSGAGAGGGGGGGFTQRGSRGGRKHGGNKPDSVATTSTSSDRPQSKQPAGKRGSLQIPTVQVDSSSTVPGENSGNRPGNKRRRSAQANQLQSVVAPAIDDNRLGPRSRNSNNSKDTPPHLAYTPPISQHMRTDIDALVERVRAVANRPTTPGRDWAGDDDDSLPDLDDWGIKTSAAKDATISPILVGSLKALPEPVTTSVTPTAPPPQALPAKATLERERNKVRYPPGALVIPPFKKKAAVPSPGLVITPASLVIPPFNPNGRKVPPRAPRSMIASAMAESASSTARPNPSPSKPMAEISSSKGTPKKEGTPLAVVVPPVAQTTPKAPVPEIKRAVHNVTNGISQVTIHNASEDKPREGLSASIHAPDPLSDSFSAPSGVSSFPIPREPRHGRQNSKPNAVSRPQSIAQPRSAAAPSFPPHRSAHNTMSPPKQEHSRTHSSPTHRSHASRPMITGDAISRLARTIAVASPRTTTTTPSKD